MIDKETPVPPTEAEWAAARAVAQTGIVENSDRSHIPSTMTNRELQQAIRETFEMWMKTDPPEGDNISKHLNTLLNLQLIRARGGYVDK